MPVGALPSNVRRRAVLEWALAGAVAGCVRTGQQSAPNGETRSAARASVSSPNIPDTVADATTTLEATPVQAPASGREATGAASTNVVAVGRESVYLLPLGAGIPDAALADVETALRAYFPFRLELLPTAPLPDDAYYPPRKRYRAERLLDYLERRTSDDARVVIGLTDADISTTKGDVYDWGILGLATLSGRQCVISRYRARRGARDEVHVRQRLAKTVVHEVGHTIGLPHCPNYGCIMEDGKGSVLTTDHERDVCAECRAKAGSAMLSARARLPW